MGDASDEADVTRFIRSDDGQKKLGEIRRSLQGRWVSDISFVPSLRGVLSTITFHTGKPLQVYLPELFLERIQSDYAAVLEEEYYRDFPERRPTTKEGA